MTEAAKRKNPFPGPKPYGALGEQPYCHRANLEKTLTDALPGSRFSLIFGAAGAGKSSILQAVVVPQLRSQGHAVLIHNQWHQAAKLADLQNSVKSAPPECRPKIEEPGWLSILSLKGGNQASLDGHSHEIILIFDQIDHLFAPGVAADDRERVLGWLAQIASERDLPVRLHVMFGVREDFSGPLLAFLYQQSCLPDFYFQVPRLRFNEVWDTACAAVPQWKSDEDLKEKVRTTRFHKDSKDPNPEVDAALAQIVLQERFTKDQEWAGSKVSYQTILRQYVNSAISQVAKGSKETIGKLLFKLSNNLVSGSQKTFRSYDELRISFADILDTDSLDNFLRRMTESNLITRVGGDTASGSIYALSHDSLCEVVESEALLVDQDLRAATIRKEADATQLQLAQVQAGVTTKVVSLLHEQAALEQTRAEQQTRQQIEELKNAYEQQLRTQREQYERQLALLLVTQKQEVENVGRLGREAEERAKAECEAKQRGLVLAQKKDLEEARRSYEAQLQGLREQHRLAVFQVSDRTVHEVRTAAIELAQAKAEGQKKLNLAEAEGQKKLNLAEAEGQNKLALVQKECSGLQTALQTREEDNGRLQQQKSRLGQGLLGAALVLPVLAALGIRGCSVQRDQTRQIGGLTQSLTSEQARCAEQQAGCAVATQSARRLTVAQQLLASDCAAAATAGRQQPAPCGNPNQAASLLLEIPPVERQRLLLWDEAARQVVRRGRLGAVALGVPVINQLDYSRDGSVLAYTIHGSGPPQVIQVRDEGTVPPGEVRSAAGVRVPRTERPLLWRNQVAGQQEPRQISLAELGLASQGRDAENCAATALRRPWPVTPHRLLPISRNLDSRILALTERGIWVRPLGCPSPVARSGSDDSSLTTEERPGASPYHYAIVDDEGMYVAAATGRYLRAISVPPSGYRGQVAGKIAVFELGLADQLMDAQFRPGAAGRLAVASGNVISFWDLAAASQQDVRALPRFATDCLDPQSRRTWLGEGDDEARKAHGACCKTAPWGQQCVPDPGSQRR